MRNDRIQSRFKDRSYGKISFIIRWGYFCTLIVRVVIHRKFVENDRAPILTANGTLARLHSSLQTPLQLISGQQAHLPWAYRVPRAKFKITSVNDREPQHIGGQRTCKRFAAANSLSLNKSSSSCLVLTWYALYLSDWAPNVGTRSLNFHSWISLYELSQPWMYRSIVYPSLQITNLWRISRCK